MFRVFLLETLSLPFSDARLMIAEPVHGWHYRLKKTLSWLFLFSLSPDLGDVVGVDSPGV